MNRREELSRMLDGAPRPDAELRALGGRAAPPLIELFAAGGGLDRDHRRRQIVRALGLLGTERAVDFLLELATDPDQPSWLVESAVRALGDTGAPRAIAFLIARLEEEGELERKSAVLALARSDHPKARRALERVAEEDSSEAVRHSAAMALGWMEPSSDDLYQGFV